MRHIASKGWEKKKKMEQRKFNLYNKSLGKAGGSMVTPKHKITSVEKEM